MSGFCIYYIFLELHPGSQFFLPSIPAVKTKNANQNIHIKCLDKGNKMNKIKDFTGQLLAILFAGYLIITYFYGLYALVVKDTYSKKELIIGMALPPYPIYVGAKEVYTTLSNEDKISKRKTKRKYTLDEFAAFLHEAQELPRMEDEITLAKSITSDGASIVYTYQITTLKKSKILKDSLQDMFTYANNKYCEQKRYIDYDRMLAKQNVPMLTKFFDKESELIDEIVFNRGSCQQEDR